MIEVRESAGQALQEAVSRALRDNLGALQRNAIELEQAFDDFVAACSSAKPGNALPAMLRAQAFAASLSASLSVLSNFTAVALSSESHAAIRERQSAAVHPVSVPPVTPQVAPPLADVEPVASAPTAFAPVAERRVASPALETVPDHPRSVDAQAMEVEPASAGADIQDPIPSEPIPALEAALHPTAFEAEISESARPEPIASAPAEEPAFDISTLPADIQDLHRRANRVAKVAMQDIKLLRPQDVQQGRENKDLCQRLRSDLDKARKEYDRRFRAIQDHPVDYFHRWMVDILAQGDEKTLGEYPYPSPVLRH